MGKETKHHVSPLIRRTFLKALKIYSRKHKITLPEAMAEWLEDDPLKVFQMVSKFDIKQAHVTGTVKHAHTGTIGLSSTADFIAGAIGTGQDWPSAELVPDRPVLLAPIRPEPEGRGAPLVISESEGDTGKP